MLSSIHKVPSTMDEGSHSEQQADTVRRQISREKARADGDNSEQQANTDQRQERREKARAMGDFSESDDRKIKNLLRDLNERRLFKDVCKRIISASDYVQSNLELLRAVVEHPTISKWSKILSV